MLQRIKINVDAIEAMLYYWQATNEKEKVGESYLNDIANLSQMNYVYDDEFSKESVRRVLSAISNREPFVSKTKKEGRFWNNNMWMLEDLEYTNMMVQPIKTLNLDFLVDKLNAKTNKKDYQEVEVIFLPGHLDEYNIVDNKLIINFFRVKPDLYEDKTTIGEKDFIEFIEAKLYELLNN
ncbi:hypothetical protein QBE52_11145 [Clostridiaceae bacterium 35-E11]